VTLRTYPTLIALLLAIGSLGLSHAAFAQDDDEPDKPGQPVSQLELHRPEAVNTLNGHLARLAENPRDVSALIGAGEAALALNDARAAVGFFARADEIGSGNGRIKAGLGHAMVEMQNPGEALRLFDQAKRLGVAEAGILSDRGLARDLTGDQAGAQRDYQAALRATPSDPELQMRYAISLGISGQPDAADKVLQPLLYKSDRTAWRDRAFIMAMNGRREQARDIAVKTMPRSLAEAIQPYMDRMQSLTPAQRAAAVHFGNFPPDRGVRVAATTPAPVTPAPAGPPQAAPSSVDTRAQEKAARKKGRSRKQKQVELASQAAPEPAPPIPPPPPEPERVATVQPTYSATPPRTMPSVEHAPVQQAPMAQSRAVETPIPQHPAAQAPVQQAAARPVVQGPPAPERSYAPPQPAPIQPAPTRTSPVQMAPAASAPSNLLPSATVTRTLAQIIQELQIPDAEKQANVNAVNLTELEAIQAEKHKAKESAAAKAKADAAAKAKAAADAKTKAEAVEKARLAKLPSRAWVQVGTGRDVSALGFTMKGLRKKYESLATRNAWTASWGRTNRLVVGPFPSFTKAKDYEDRLKKAGADAFAWQSDAGEEVEKLSDK
jgi:hypothetical protein